MTLEPNHGLPIVPLEAIYLAISEVKLLVRVKQSFRLTGENPW